MTRTGISSLYNFHLSHKRVQKVKTTTLRKYIKDRKINEIEFLKIDTEGWDYFVLQGFPFDKIKPRIVLCEFEDSKTLPLGYSWRDMAEFFLKSYKYKVIVSEWYPVIRYGGPHRWRDVMEYPCNLNNNKATGNIIACQNDRDATRIIKYYRIYKIKEKYCNLSDYE